MDKDLTPKKHRHLISLVNTSDTKFNVYKADTTYYVKYSLHIFQQIQLFQVKYH